MVFNQIIGLSETSAETSLGKISLCPYNNCKFGCTDFSSGNYIVLYPGELENAEAAGYSTRHLRVIDRNYHGGARAICEAKEPESCDNGYKPLDCASYPLFPHVLEGDVTVTRLLRGTKCPLLLTDIRKHALWVIEIWNKMIAARPAILEWLRRVRLIGYESVKE
jgi:hypothetical protein